MINLTEITYEMIEALDAASVWRIPENDNSEVTSLARWWIVEVIREGEDTPSRHLCGCTFHDEGRVTSAIQSVVIEDRSLIFTTRSGARYKTSGHPGHGRNAEYVWNRWKSINKVSDEKEVTADYWNHNLNPQKGGSPRSL